MKRIALYLLPLFVLTACERGVPTAADLSDGVTTATLAVTIDVNADVSKVNLATASTVQVVVPSAAVVPISAVLTNTDNGIAADPLHTFDAGCTTHFQDLDADGVIDALILHFDTETLFGSYDITALPVDPIVLDLAVEWEDGTTYAASYNIQLAYSVPNGFRGGR
jgi:hypothetical protein